MTDFRCLTLNLGRSEVLEIHATEVQDSQSQHITTYRFKMPLLDSQEDKNFTIVIQGESAENADYHAMRYLSDIIDRHVYSLERIRKAINLSDWAKSPMSGID